MNHTSQFPFGVILDVQNDGPTLGVDRGGSFARFEQFDDALDGQDDAALGHIHNHPYGGQGGDEVLRMRWPYRNRNRTQIQAPVKSANQIQSRWEYQRHVIAWVDFAALLEQRCDLLGSFVQLGTGEGLGDGTLGVQQGVQYVVGRRVGSPSEHSGNQLMLERKES